VKPAFAGPLARLARVSPGDLQAQTFPSSAYVRKASPCGERVLLLGAHHSVRSYRLTCR
jgi:hypothetical protein